MRLVCELKNIERETIEADIESVIEEVMLTQHKHKQANQLSGGMKRKLSLAMALIGKSKLVILDEPTSGLDVDSRQKIWTLIRKMRETRTVILCTQHIEEADELSDLVCIMANGKVSVLDTSQNIKKRFGVGYHLILEQNGARLPVTELDSAIMKFREMRIEVEDESTDLKRRYTVPDESKL